MTRAPLYDDAPVVPAEICYETNCSRRTVFDSGTPAAKPLPVHEVALYSILNFVKGHSKLVSTSQDPALQPWLINRSATC